jgi:CPA1 family monovalent cation:H+ antiporter
MLPIVAILLVLTAAFAYVNHQLLKWPTTIGVMAIALLVSLAVIGLDHLGLTTLRNREHELLASINFADVLLEGMLSLLLFAGALHVDLDRVRRLSWQIGVLAVIGTAASAAVIGGGCWLLLGACDVQLPLIWCLLFGALISPTDPIAVLGVLESAHAPADVETTIAGESLVNDGVGVVLIMEVMQLLSTRTIGHQDSLPLLSSKIMDTKTPYIYSPMDSLFIVPWTFVDARFSVPSLFCQRVVMHALC